MATYPDPPPVIPVPESRVSEVSTEYGRRLMVREGRRPATKGWGGRGVRVRARLPSSAAGMLPVSSTRLRCAWTLWAVSGNPSGIPGSYVRRGDTREGVMMGGSRPARRRSGGGRDGGWGLRLVAVDGCVAAGRSTGSAWARAAAPGSLAAGHFQRTSYFA